MRPSFLAGHLPQRLQRPSSHRASVLTCSVGPFAQSLIRRRLTTFRQAFRETCGGFPLNPDNARCMAFPPSRPSWGSRSEGKLNHALARGANHYVNARHSATSGEGG